MITVIAGVNGAGKSSVFGSHIRSLGDEYFNPDEVARQIMASDSDLTQNQANALAWQMNLDLLKLAIETDADYTFETTLGGNTICDTLHCAIDQGTAVRILFCGLKSVEQHIQRVADRVAKGGHHIPENKIRERWVSSLHNMMGLIARCHAIRVVDNSRAVNELKILFAFEENRFISAPVNPMPEWAKPLASAAIMRIAPQ